MKKPSLTKVQSQMNNVLDNNKRVFKNMFCCNNKRDAEANDLKTSISFDGEFININLFGRRKSSVQEFEMF